MTKKLWLDVSHILGWNGRLTGIERVEYHLIKYYFENTDAGFIKWDKNNEVFLEADRDEVNNRIIWRTSEQELKGQNNGTLPDSLTAKIRRRLSKTASKQWRGEGNIIVLAGLWDNKAYIDGLIRLSEASPLIHVIYDMIPIVKSEFVVDFLPGVFSDYMFKVLPHCKAFLAISEATKKDAIKLLESKGLPMPKADSFRLGDDLSRAKKALPPKDVKGDFILSAGTIEARKNHQLLYVVYKKAAKEGYKLPNLIIAGGRGWLTEELQHNIENDPTVNQKIRIIDKATDEQMRWLYENCLFSVFPSLYEGWGLPVAESLAYGKVTLASNTSSIPEVGGKCADYFSPTSVDELLELIIKYTKPKIRADREAYILDHYSPTDWTEAVKMFDKKLKDL